MKKARGISTTILSLTMTLALALLLAGCGGGGGGVGGETAPAASTGAVSGKITYSGAMTVSRATGRNSDRTAAVTLNPGDGVPGATVYVEGQTSVTTTTDGAGNYALTGVPAGVITIVSEKDDVNGKKFKYRDTGNNVEAGVTITVNIELRKTSSIEGYVKNDNGEDLSGVLLEIGGQQSTSDSTGYYKVFNMPVGSQELTAQKSEYKSFSAIVSTGEAATTFNVEMLPDSSTIQNPVITLSASSASVNVGEIVTIAASATNPNSGTLSYLWSWTGGSGSSSEGASISWTAPSSLPSLREYYVASVTVTDRLDGISMKSIEIEVTSTGAICGNGTIETGEQCDDGNATAGDGCSSSCQNETCGNATVETGEDCDDGNTTSYDGCSSTCITENLDLVTITGGTLNATTISATSKEITVAVGESISGTVNLTAHNGHGSGAVFPVCMTNSWGAHSGSYTTIDSWASAGDTDHTVTVSMTAPTTAGTYYILYADAGQMSCSNIVSVTCWTDGNDTWDDGNDMADWDSTTVDAFKSSGGAVISENCGGSSQNTWYGANAITVTVTEGTSSNAWITIPAGDFVMGCASADTDCDSDESPKHTVTLSEYKIQKYEVTNAQYKQCVDAGTCDAPSSSSSYTHSSYYGNATYDNYPVIYVDWYKASTYCGWISGRLPTEAEWEKAARGPSPSENIYPWGDSSPTSSLANYNSNVGDTTEVGSYASGASYYGAMDMAGNVWEWVNDWYSSSYYSSSPSTDPTGPTSGTYRVLRGGSWYDGTRIMRASYRFYYGLPTHANYDFGFRCAQD